MKLNKTSSAILAAMTTAGTLGVSSGANADAFIDALTSGKTFATTRLRYESVEQDNALDDATAVTLRTRLGYTTGNFMGFTATAEFEDGRVAFGEDEYAPLSQGFSVIGDPEFTEVDQAFIQYNSDIFTTKIGRQVVTLDNQRFIGHVAWRNNRQTFDAARFMVTPIENFKIDYTYINGRNTPKNTDVKTEDHFLNLSYQTPVGKVSGYTYIIDLDNDLDDALSTYGIRFAGSTGDDITFKYAAEYASQTKEQEVGDDFDADYLLAEFGLGFSGINLTLGYEQLGSDDAKFGFSTPYATGHKFAGFADQFLETPNEGLQDTYFTVSGKLAGIKLAATYHDFSADESTDTVDDLGSEIDFVAVKPIGKNYLVGFKYAAYSAGDDAAGKVDTDKLWLWTELKF